MTDPETPEQPERRHDRNEPPASRAPFDTSDLNNIPRTTEDDPPYRNWWVVTEPDNRR